MEHGKKSGWNRLDGRAPARFELWLDTLQFFKQPAVSGIHSKSAGPIEGKALLASMLTSGDLKRPLKCLQTKSLVIINLAAPSTNLGPLLLFVP